MTPLALALTAAGAGVLGFLAGELVSRARIRSLVALNLSLAEVSQRAHLRADALARDLDAARARREETLLVVARQLRHKGWTQVELGPDRGKWTRGKEVLHIDEAILRQAALESQVLAREAQEGTEPPGRGFDPML